MGIARRCLFWAVVLFCLAESRGRLSPPADRSGEQFFADMLNEVLRTSRPKDILLILRDSSPDRRRADGILGKISATTSRRVPALYVNAHRSEFQVSSRAMSRDLVVYIYVSEREPDNVEGELVADDLRRFVHIRIRPKVLVLMILGRPCRDLATLFRAIWSRKILDTIIVEYSRSERSTVVHRYDPFTDSLTSEPYSANVVWFTNDFPNMQGYPFTYAFTRRTPYSDIVITPSGRKNPKGLDQLVIEMLVDKMNFTIVPVVIKPHLYLMKLPNGSLCGIMPDVQLGKYDALLNTIAMVGKLSLQFTDAVFIEEWCFVVPRLLIRHNFVDFSTILLFVVGFSIVGVFWLCSRLMRLDPGRWHPLRIIGIMLATSFPSGPTRMHERIVFLSIFAACARYSSTLFAELTSISLESDRYIQFDHLQDLMKSNLAVMTHRNILQIIMQENNILERYVHKLGKKVEYVADMEICLKQLITHQNVTCFMERDSAKLYAVNNMRDGKTMLKTTKLCYLSPPAGYVFPEGSPYIRRVSDLLLMLAEGGIRTKWYHDYLRNETKETTIEFDKNETEPIYVSVFHPMLYVLILGHSISVLVFIGELIWKHFDINLSQHAGFDEYISSIRRRHKSSEKRDE